MSNTCPHCGRMLTVDPQQHGDFPDCPFCSRRLMVPGPSRKFGGTAVLATLVIGMAAAACWIWITDASPDRALTSTRVDSQPAGAVDRQEPVKARPEPAEPPSQSMPVDFPESGVDLVAFGDMASENAHSLVPVRSEILRGGLVQPARRLLPGGPFPWEGGSVAWTMKVDPVRQNYLTVKLWGADKGYQTGRLILFANGLQVGYRHEGDYDFLNQCDDEPLAPGRFVYVTVPLPPNLTIGKQGIDLKILSTGPVWFYGADFNRYQKPFTGPSRGIYRAYTHVSPRFVPSGLEKQGGMPQAAARTTPGPEVIDECRDIVVKRVAKILADNGVPGNIKARAEMVSLLAESYGTSWTPAWRNRRAIERIIRIGDAMVADFSRDTKPIEGEWIGAGCLGQALMLTWPDMRRDMEDEIQVDGVMVRRGGAWARLLAFSRDHWRTHRRSYTNQSMIVDWGIYAANRGLLLIDPQRALPEERALAFLYQSAGIDPWLGSDLAGGGSEKPYGGEFRLLTRKGLSRELGYVGTYGETILTFSRDMAVLTGDRKLREQTRRMQLARHYFRYPAVDADGFRCMKLVSEIDNRTAHYPHAGAAYNAPAIRECWWMETAALFADDPAIVGAAWQSVADGQYFHHVRSRLNDADTLGMMRNVDNWTKVRDLPKISRELPATPGQPDFCFADEENAVVAIKRGDTLLFINLYYRAERAVNRVARVFEIAPDITRLATVRSDVEIISSGGTYTRPDWMDRVRSRGLTPPGQEIRQAWAGEVMPVAKRPDGASLPKYGDWGPFVGKAAFYSLRYGDLLIGLNTTSDRSYSLAVPGDVGEVRDLVSGKLVKPAGKMQVPPLSTVVLDLRKSG